MPGSGSSPVFIGRGAELDRLDAIFRRAAAGSSSAVVVIEGEAGIGKSRLVEEFCERITAAGGRGLSGGAMEIEEANLPYVPVLEALRPIVQAALAGDPDANEAIGGARPELAQLFPELEPTLREGRPDIGLAQTRLFGQVLGVLDRLGRQRPLVVVLEDLQWADRSTRDLVRFLARTLNTARVVLVVTVRTDALHSRHPLTPLLAEIGRLPRVETVSVRRFSPAEHAAQVEALLGHRPPPEVLARTYARSEGNAFFTEELVAPGGEGATTLPSSLRGVLLARIRGFDERTRRVLRVLAVGWSVTHPLLEAVAELPSDELLASLREAVDRATITPDPASGRYRFRHPLIAEAIYDDLLPGERLRIHAAYARALERNSTLGDPSPPRAAAELANHWIRAGEERRALPALLVAARAARSSFAQAEAFDHLERALSIAEAHPDALADVGITLLELTRLAAEAAEGAGEFARAIELWERCLELVDAEADPVAAGLLHARVGETHWLAGDRERITRHRRRAVELVPATPPTPARARVLSRLASALLSGPHVEEAVRLAREAAAVARATGAEVEEEHARGVLGTALLLRGEVDDAVELLRASVRSAQLGGRLADEAVERSRLADALHAAARLREAFEVVREGLERLAAARVEHAYGGTMTAIAVDLAYLLGEWEIGSRLMADGVARATPGLPSRWLALVRAEFAAARGAWDEVRSAVGEWDVPPTFERVTGWTGPHEQFAQIALFAGQPDVSLRHARAAIAALDAGGHPPGSAEWRWILVRAMWAVADLAAAARRGRQPAEASALEAEAEHLIERFRANVALQREPSGHVALDAMLVDAEFDRALGRSDPQRWHGVADAYTAADHIFDGAIARYREAEAWLASGGSRRRAAAALGEARAVAHRLGSAPLLGWIDALARRGGIRLPSLPTASDPPGTPEAADHLTRREREILGLLGEGRSNQEIGRALYISSKTVSVHLTNIRAKLAATSRVEIVTTALQRGLLSQPAASRPDREN